MKRSSRFSFYSFILPWVLSVTFIPQALALPGATPADCRRTDQCHDSLIITASVSANRLYTPLSQRTETASHLELALKDTPRYVDVVDASAISLQQLRTLTEVVETSTGMSGVTSPSLSNSVSLRGFTPVGWLYNGVEMPGSTLQSALPAHYERVEILHGTGSVLHGLSSAGGSVNMVSRKASFSRQPLEFDYGYSSFASHRGHVGMGGALVKEVLAGRLDVSAADGGSQAEGERWRPLQVSGALALRLSDQLLLTLEVDRMVTQRLKTYYGTPLVDRQLKRELRHINYNNLQDSSIRGRATSLQSALEWFITPQFSFQNTFYYYKGFREWHDVEDFSYSVAKPGYVTRQSFGDLAHEDQLTGNRSLLVLNGSPGGVENQAVLGFDISRQSFQYAQNGWGGDARQDVPMFAPPALWFSDVTQKLRQPLRNVVKKQWALILEDRLEVSEQWSVLAQARYNWVDIHWHYQPQQQEMDKRHRFMSLGVGPVYKPAENLMLYANYSIGKEPGGDLFFIGPAQTTLPLTSVRQWEAGLKGQFWQQRGQLALALYDLRKFHLFSQDASQPDILHAVGQQTSQGVELNFALTPIEQLTVSGNLAYTRARFNQYRQGGVDFWGKTPRYVPVWNGNLALRYQPVKSLGLTAAWHYVGSSYNNDANSEKMPAYSTLNIGADYQLLPQVTLGLMVRNLTDSFYGWQRTYPVQRLIGEPRTYEAYVSITY